MGTVYIPIGSTVVLLSIQYPVTSSPPHFFPPPWPFCNKEAMMMATIVTDDGMFDHPHPFRHLTFSHTLSIYVLYPIHIIFARALVYNREREWSLSVFILG